MAVQARHGSLVGRSTIKECVIDNPEELRELRENTLRARVGIARQGTPIRTTRAVELVCVPVSDSGSDSPGLKSIRFQHDFAHWALRIDGRYFELSRIRGTNNVRWISSFWQHTRIKQIFYSRLLGSTPFQEQEILDLGPYYVQLHHHELMRRYSDTRLGAYYRQKIFGVAGFSALHRNCQDIAYRLCVDLIPNIDKVKLQGLGYWGKRHVVLNAAVGAVLDPGVERAAKTLESIPGGTTFLSAGLYLLWSAFQ